MSLLFHFRRVGSFEAAAASERAASFRVARRPALPIRLPTPSRSSPPLHAYRLLYELPLGARLAIGEMEDDRVGDEAKAQAAAFFDCVPGYPPQTLDAVDDGRGQSGEGVSFDQGMGAVSDTRAGSRAGSDKQHSGARAATGSGARLGSGAEGLSTVGEGLEGRTQAWFLGDGSE